MEILLDNPFKFFKKERTIRHAASYLAVFAGIFVIFNEISIRLEFTKFMPIFGVLESMILNFILVIVGVIVISFILKVIGKIKFFHSFGIISYSMTPFLLIGWIPFAVFSILSLVWSMIFITAGIQMKTKMSYKKSFFFVVILLAIAGAMLLAGSMITDISMIIPLN